MTAQKKFVIAHKSSFPTISQFTRYYTLKKQLFYHIGPLRSLGFLSWENDLYERSQQVTPYNTKYCHQNTNLLVSLCTCLRCGNHPYHNLHPQKFSLII